LAIVVIFVSIGGVTVSLYLNLHLREYGKFIFPAILDIFLLLSVALLAIAIKKNWKASLKGFNPNWSICYRNRYRSTFA